MSDLRTRNHKGRFVSKSTMNERIDALRRAGFSLAYVHRSDVAECNGHAPNRIVTDGYYQGHRTITVTGDDHEYYGTAYVDLGKVACTEDAYGQRSLVDRANYVAIKRDFPQYPWVDRLYSNIDCLGIFVADLDDEMLGLLTGLADDYPIYDEGTYSQLEQDAIHASWDGWLRSELWWQGSEPFRSVWDRFGEGNVESTFWNAVSDGAFGNYPEHNGVEVLWGDRDKLFATFKLILLRAYWASRLTSVTSNDDSNMEGNR